MTDTLQPVIVAQAPAFHTPGSDRSNVLVLQGPPSHAVEGRPKGLFPVQRRIMAGKL